MADELDATGLVTSVVGRGVTDGSGTQTAAIVLMQYNPTLTVLMDKRPASELLAGGVKAVKAFIPGKVTVTDHVLSGSQDQLLRLAECHPARIPATSTCRRTRTWTQFPNDDRTRLEPTPVSVGRSACDNSDGHLAVGS